MGCVSAVNLRCFRFAFIWKIYLPTFFLYAHTYIHLLHRTSHDMYQFSIHMHDDGMSFLRIVIRWCQRRISFIFIFSWLHQNIVSGVWVKRELFTTSSSFIERVSKVAPLLGRRIHHPRRRWRWKIFFKKRRLNLALNINHESISSRLFSIHLCRSCFLYIFSSSSARFNTTYTHIFNKICVYSSGWSASCSLSLCATILLCTLRVQWQQSEIK